MKPLLELITHTNAAGIQTVSRFRRLSAEDHPQHPLLFTKIVTVFDECKQEDGDWGREYAMTVDLTTQLDIYYLLDGVKTRLTRQVTSLGPDGEQTLEVPVTCDEFTLMRFLCWDYAIVPMKYLAKSALLRRKAKEAAERAGEMPAPYDFTLPNSIPPGMFLSYLKEVLGAA